jgi:predicted ABC-type ATPase
MVSGGREDFIMANGQPEVIILAGPNGAGKTTASQRLLADTLGVLTFVNADTIARGLAGFDLDSAAIESSRIMLQWLRQLAQQRASFAFETTLAGLSYAALLSGWKIEGYAIRLFYFWVGSAELAVARVAGRVRSGGHDVPEATILQRYERSMRNFFAIYRALADSWRWYDNTRAGAPRLLAEGKAREERIFDQPTWQQILAQVSS